MAARACALLMLKIRLAQEFGAACEKQALPLNRERKTDDSDSQSNSMPNLWERFPF
jgi:hypothetical protein